MTVGRPAAGSGKLVEVRYERGAAIEFIERVGLINGDLTVGANVTRASELRANAGLACPGIQLSGQGFVVSACDVARFNAPTRTKLLRPYVTGRDLTQIRREQYVIDTFGLSEAQLRDLYPDAYQWLHDRVKPEREQNPRQKYARDWWLHSEPRATFRSALKGLRRFVGTSRTARHRVFEFLDARVLPETKVLVFALEDAFELGVLSSRLHVTFALAAGGWLGAGNDPTYNHSDCFYPFPFPACDEHHESRIRGLAESLDSHRKRQQAANPDLTITAMYNVLEKLSKGEPLTEKDRRIHEQGLVSVLKQIHDDLDAAVAEAYGWPADLSDEEILRRLVALNAERAEEEKRGLIRWLRPEFQNPTGVAATQQTLALEPAGKPTKTSPRKRPPGPKRSPTRPAPSAPHCNPAATPPPPPNWRGRFRAPRLKRSVSSSKRWRRSGRREWLAKGSLLRSRARTGRRP